MLSAETGRVGGLNGGAGRRRANTGTKTMSAKPVLLATLLLIGLSMIDNGKPPRIPLFQAKDVIETVSELRPDPEA